MQSNPHSISVIDPLTRALDHTRAMLLQPFDLQKWFVIGFCAWLAQLGQGGLNGGFNYGGGPHHSSSPQQVLDQAHHYVTSNLAWLLPLAIFLFALILAIWVLVVWLSSRGKFMFLHCVALNRAEVAAPWSMFAPDASSLFVFRLLLGLGGTILFLPVLVLMLFMAFGIAKSGSPNFVMFLPIIGLGLVMLGFAIVWAIIAKLTNDFIVPIMFLRRAVVTDAWRILWDLIRIHLGEIVLYFLFQILLAMAIGAILLLVILLTCCIAGCLMLIPYIGTVLILPIPTFQRAYSAFYLAQFGSDFDVFPQPLPPLTGPLPSH